jgi:hypothetical protein
MNHVVWACALVLGGAANQSQVFSPSCVLSSATYRGWDSRRLTNGLVELQVVPAIGGRVIQYKLGDKEFLWVNPQLAGKLPPSSGLADDGSWLNYGGDKLWPAPQGWDNDSQWPGPPDAVLDGQPYASEELPAERGEAGLHLTSGPDARSGIQFSRVIRIFEGSTRVSFEASMKNIDTRPRRWGIWAHTQLDAANADGSSFNSRMCAWCPLNPQSRFPQGYSVIFGAPDNPSFQLDPARGLLRVPYQYQVGKVGLDSPAGWVATVDGASGRVFVQRFVFEPERAYPDGASVEFWHNGVGTIHAYNRDMVMADDPAENPYVFESEVLSPFAALEPGETYTWRYDWFATSIGGDLPVIDCNSSGVVVQPLRAVQSAGQVALTGRFGVFVPGTVRAEYCDASGALLSTRGPSLSVGPLAPVVIDMALDAPPDVATIRLILDDRHGAPLGELARAGVQAGQDDPRWPADRAKMWYDRQPWLVGCNFLPSTAVNDIEISPAGSPRLVNSPTQCLACTTASG